MKKTTLLILLFIGTSSFAQQLFLETGKTASSFDFKNSQGSNLENLQAVSNSYVSVGFNTPISSNNLDLFISLVYNSYGAIGSDDALNNYYEWNTDYLGLNIGLNYNVFKINKFDFYLKAGASVEFIVQGTQTINNQVFNIVNVEEFDNPAIFLRGGAGISYPIAQNCSLYFQYVYGKSLALKDSNNSGSSELKIKSNMVGLGLITNL